MRILCSNCNLKCTINEKKEKLDKILMKKNGELLDEGVISLSNEISKLIANCISCSYNNFSKSRGRYLYEKFHYYGKKHLLVNLYSYMKEALDNEQLIYISTRKQLHERLAENFEINGLSVNNIKFISIEDASFIKNKVSFKNIKAQVDEFFQYNSERYNGIRWIIDTNYISNVTLEGEFINAKDRTRNFVRHMDINILYVFNAYESFDKDEEVILRNVINE